MKYRSVFDIIGPIMIGPSSSHTAGVVRIGRLARELFGEEIQSALIHFYGSFSQTYKGHATDVAIVGGLLGFDTDDKRIKNALEHAQAAGVAIEFVSSSDPCEHPNTITMHLKNIHKSMKITGVSLGGGTVSITAINGFHINLSGENPSLLISHQDAFGAISAVSKIFADNEINIAHMEVSRSDKGGDALMIIESDQSLHPELVQALCCAKHVKWVKLIE